MGLMPVLSIRTFPLFIWRPRKTPMQYRLKQSETRPTQLDPQSRRGKTISKTEITAKQQHKQLCVNVTKKLLTFVECNNFV